MPGIEAPPQSWATNIEPQTVAGSRATSPVEPPSGSFLGPPAATGDFKLGLEAVTTLQLLLRHRGKIVAMTFAAALIGAALTFVLPSYYQAKVQLLPSAPDDGLASMGLGQAAGLASTFGINVGTPSLAMAYPDILKSRDIRERVLDRTFAITAATSAALLAILPVKGSTPDVRRAGALDYLDKKVRVGINKETGVLELVTTMRDPELARAVAQAYVEELIRIEAELRERTARINKEFVEKRLTETEAQLRVAENMLQQFEAQNIRLGNDPELQLHRVRLGRDVRIQEEIYLTLVRQHELAKIEENRSGSGIQVLDPARRPLTRSSPILLKNVILAAFLGGVGASILMIAIDWSRTARDQSRRAMAAPGSGSGRARLRA